MKKFDPVACCTHIELDTTRWPGSLPAPCGNLIKKAIEDSEHDYDVQKRKPRQRQGWINMKHMRFMHTPITSATCFVLFCCSVTELFTDLCLSPGFTIRENPPRAFLCVCVCVSLFFVPGITSSRRGREREKSNAMSHSVLERERGWVAGWENTWVFHIKRQQWDAICHMGKTDFPLMAGFDRPVDGSPPWMCVC